MSNLLDSLTGLVSSKLETYRALAAVFQLETRLAAMSISPFVFNVCLIFVVLLTLWFCLMGLLVAGLFAVWHSIFTALAAVLALNLVFCFILYRLLLSNLRKMSFEKTREYFSDTEEDNYHDSTPENLYPVTANEQAVKTATE